MEEWELTRCVEDVFKVRTRYQGTVPGESKKYKTDFSFGSCLRQIWVVGDGSSAALLSALEDVLPVVFTLFCFSRQNVSHLR